MQWPNFLIIGAPRSGTTTIYEGLRQHPEIFMSPFKEPWFFALEGKTEPYNGPGDNDPVRTGIRDEDAYLALFNGVMDEKAIGEASTLYLYSPEAAIRIRERLPEVKLIAILRSPVDRAYSNYLQHIQQGRETLSFENAIQAEDERFEMVWSPFWFYRRMGKYGEQLERYLNLFDREQILILRYEHLKENPEKLLMRVFRFLGVDENQQIVIPKRHNTAGIPKNTGLNSLLNQIKKAKYVNIWMKKIIPSQVRKTIKFSVVDSIMGKNLSKPPLQPITRQQLIHYFKADIIKTQTLIQEDLSNWFTN